ncbi:1,4-beta-xylanase [Balamuthia mandrillaris]
MTMRSHLALSAELFCVLLTLASLPAVCPGQGPQQQGYPPWSVRKAQQWAEKTGWLVGCNYIPSTALNQLEMFQKATWDPLTIDRELALAQRLGFNSVRVFLHHLLWKPDDPREQEEFLQRLDQFLGIADRHHLRATLVLFDGCWDANPRPGKQRPPIPFVHNSGWLQSPGTDLLLAFASSTAEQQLLESYVKGVVSRFANDSRVVLWDVFNEPDNPNRPSYLAYTPSNKAELALGLLRKAYSWIRDIAPVQPLTSGVWDLLSSASSSSPCSFLSLSPLVRFQLEQSDVISFHNYGPLKEVQAVVRTLMLCSHPAGRPLLNTEFMARPMGSTFDPLLAWFKQHKIGAHSWGLVAGKTQAMMPWDSWWKVYQELPDVWFHDIFRADGTPFSPWEVEYIRNITGAADSILRA